MMKWSNTQLMLERSTFIHSVQFGEKLGILILIEKLFAEPPSLSATESIIKTL